ncbi:cytochrome P450 [Guyanagaster necrorhizus]|uniref:Cytochrome P450 n=1 Tax=Guyanagaster necrorhizus TaxID=856835 RepID=A0A9P7VG96_9AGAR|nr:cytochrome P450 [Guyanagaster necrorhizus MCA 3950]KAG7439845.1 cytochrome P450 [Guyanagaster necrorhizus MCA 3950]
MMLLLSIIFIFCIYRVLSRLIFHPLRAFPGPKIAALTSWYVAYWETIRDGMLTKELERLHRIYGPVVRISPNASKLHFNTPRAFFSIYSTQANVIKDRNFYWCFHVNDSVFGFTDPALVKKRRDILNPLFSRRSIMKLENIIQSKVDTLMGILSEEYREKPVDLHQAFKATAMDIITAYCFAQSFDALHSLGFAHPIIRGMEASVATNTAVRHLPILVLLYSLPEFVMAMINPESVGIFRLQKVLGRQIDKILADPGTLEAVHDTIYHRLLEDGERPSRKALLEEAQTLILAGTDTTSNAMTMGFFHILTDPSMRTKLVAELKAAWPEKGLRMSYDSLEKLPYLTGVVKESLRMSIGVPVSLPRVLCADTDIDGYSVPAGTVVGMGTSFVLMNEDMFPEPEVFNPDRWIESPSLDKYLVPFSKGPRACLGMNLAWCELYLVFGNLFRKFDMEIYETNSKDLSFRSHFLPIFCGRHLHATVREYQ